MSKTTDKKTPDKALVTSGPPIPQPEEPQPEEQEPVEQVSVVIVSCNRIDALRAGLTALHAAVPNPALQIIVVDNGSRDGSASLDTEFPATQFLRLPQNFGLTKALNIGIRACDGTYVLFLHEDVEITPETVELLRAELEQRSDTGAACPLLVDEAGSPLPQVRDLPSTSDPDPAFRPGRVFFKTTIQVSAYICCCTVPETKLHQVLITTILEIPELTGVCSDI